METEHIKEFLVMAEKLNYTAASDELFISQSSLFKHIRALEEELGVAFFAKEGKKVVMTEYGKMFVHHAKVMLHQIDAYQEEVENHREAKANIINIIDEYPNPELGFAFRKAYPQFTLSPQFLSTIDGALNSEAEILVLRGELPEFDAQFDHIDLTTDSIAVVVPNDHPLAGRKSIRMIDLKDEEIIGFSLNNQYVSESRLESMHDVASMCRGAGFEPNIIMSAFPGSEVARLVSQGGGISLLYKKATMRRMGGQVTFIDLDPEMTFPVRAYSRKGKELSKAAKAYIDYAKDWYESYK